MPAFFEGSSLVAPSEDAGGLAVCSAARFGVNIGAGLSIILTKIRSRHSVNSAMTASVSKVAV